jgi:hypothetical protein
MSFISNIKGIIGERILGCCIIMGIVDFDIYLDRYVIYLYVYVIYVVRCYLLSIKINVYTYFVKFEILTIHYLLHFYYYYNNSTKKIIKK